MAKKVKKADKAKKVQLSAKEVLEGANKALTTFLKTNKLARDEDHSKNKKFGKEFKELTLAVEKAQEAMDEGNGKAAKAKTKEKAKDTDKKVKAASKEKSGSAGRATVYDYPDGLTPAEKKEFRVKARKAAKAGSKPDTKKADKKSDKASKPSKEETKSKGGKKEVAKVETKEISKKKKKKVKKND